MIKKAVVKGLALCIILVIILSFLGSIFVLKTDQRAKLTDGLYKSKDQYDVVFMGSSHMNGGMDPNVLWRDYGITSFNYATGGQPIDVTYYLLKEVLKKQKNPIVVIDIYYLGLTDKYGDQGYVRNALDGMKFSLNKLDAIQNCVPLKDRISYLLPILKYHERWSELSKSDINFDNLKYYPQKGFEAGTNKYGKDRTTVVKTTAMEDIPAKANLYLNKIIELSKKQGFKLVFINTPYDYKDTLGASNWVKEPEKIINKVKQVAKSNNIEFVDYNDEDKFREIGLDFKNDMNNSGHLNVWGASKVTEDFGGILKEKFKLSDHRSDIKYKQWNVDYNKSQIAILTKKVDKN